MTDLLILTGTGLRFTVPGLGAYGQEIDGRRHWDNFTDAVKAAQSTIRRIDYAGHHGYTRACIDVRVNATAGDYPILRFEVFRDRVVVVPHGQGGLTDEQKTEALGKTLSFLRIVSP